MGVNQTVLNIVTKLNKNLSKKQLNSNLRSFDNKFSIRILAKLQNALLQKEIKKALKKLKELSVSVEVKADTSAMKQSAEKDVSYIKNAISDIVTLSESLQSSLDVSKAFTESSNGIGNMLTQLHTLGSAMDQVENLPIIRDSRTQAITRLGESTRNLSDENLRLVLSNRHLSEGERIRILTARNLTNEEAEAKLAEMGLTIALRLQNMENRRIAQSTPLLIRGFNILKISIKGVGASIKAAFLSNPIGWIITGISTAVSLVTGAVKKYNKEMEEAKQNTRENAEKANTYGDEIAELTIKYFRLTEAVKTDIDAKDELLSTQSELLDKLGIESGSIDSLIEKYGSLKEAIRQLSGEELKKARIDLINGKEVAKEDFLKASDKATFEYFRFDFNDDPSMEGYDILEKNNIVHKSSENSDWRELNLEDYTSIDGALKNYQLIEKAMNAMRESGKFTSTQLSENSVYQQLLQMSEDLKESYEAYQSITKDISENLVQESTLPFLQELDTIDSVKSFEALKQEIIATVAANNDFIGSQEEAADAVSNYLYTIPELQKYYDPPAVQQENAEIMNTKKALTSLKETIDLLDNGTLSNLEISSLVREYGLDANAANDSTESLRQELEKVAKIKFDTAINSLDSMLKEGQIDKSAYTHYIHILREMKNEAVSNSSKIDDLNNSSEEQNKTLSDTSDEAAKAADKIKKLTQAENALLRAEQELALTKQLEILTGHNLLNISQDEIYQLARQGKITKETALQMSALALKKQGVNKNTIITAKDIDNIAALADSSSKLGKIYLHLAALKNAIEHGASESISNDSIKILQNYINAFTPDLTPKDLPTDEPPAEDPPDMLPDTAPEPELEKQTINWIDRKLEILSRHYVAIKTKAQDLLTTWKNQNKEIDAANKKIQDYQENYDKAKESKTKIDALQKELKNNFTLKIDNIKDDTEKRIALINQRIALRTTKADDNETKKDFSYYIRQTKNSRDKYQKEYKQIQALLKKGLADKTFTKSDDEYFIYQEELLKIKEQIGKCDASVKKWKQSISSLDLKVYDDYIEKLNRIQDKITAAFSLLSGENFDENGSLTKTGLASLALNYQGIASAKQEIANYDACILKLNKQYKKGSLAQSEYTQKLNEYKSAQKEASLQVKQYTDAILEFKKKGIEAEISAFEEAINKQKQLLQSEKDLSDYQKSITDKAKEAARIQKEINALSGDDSLENQKKLRELKANLEKAQEALSSAEKEHSTKEKQDALDQSLDDFKEEKNKEISELTTNLSKQETILNSYLSMVKNSYSSAMSIINDYAQYYGIELNDVLKSPWENAILSAASYSEYIKQISKPGQANQGNFNFPFLGISPGKSAMIDYTLKNASGKGGSSKLNQHVYSTYGTYLGNADMVQLAKLLGIEGVTSKSIAGNKKQKDAIYKALKKAGFLDGGIAAASRLHNEPLKRLTGEDGFALISHGESVLTRQQTGDFQKLAGKLDQINHMTNTYSILENMLPSASLPDDMAKQTLSAPPDVNIHFTLPNVKDTNSFVTELQHSSRFEKIVQEITLGRMLGGNSLEKYKY